MNLATSLAMGLDPSLILEAQGISPDPWQRAFLLSNRRENILNCSRQSGKSTTVAALAIHTAIFQPGSLILILSPGLRQSGEFFRKIKDAYNAIGRPLDTPTDNASTLELANGSRIVCLPGKEATIRSYSKVKLLIVDEASRVADDLYKAVRPMLTVGQGRLVMLSTPFGQRGFFFREWFAENGMHKVQATWKDCPRISPDFITNERRAMGDDWVAQEYECKFTSVHGLVYPDFEEAIIDLYPTGLSGPLVGGIDFGWRNPFAAIWGFRHHLTDTLYIVGERYLRETPLHEHADALKKLKGVLWYADPAGRTETEELRHAGVTVRRGDNHIQAGIAAVSARIKTGRLKILRTGCPSLIQEAQLYRYPAPSERTDSSPGENPVDANNHALGALRYLISKIDARFMARLKGRSEILPGTEDHAEQVEEAQLALGMKKPEPAMDPNNEDLWEML